MMLSSMLHVVFPLTIFLGLSSFAEAGKSKRSMLSDLEFELTLLKTTLKSERNTRVELEKTVDAMSQRIASLEWVNNGGGRGGSMRSLPGNVQNPIQQSIQMLQDGLQAEKNRNLNLESAVTEVKNLLFHKFNDSVIADWQADLNQCCQFPDFKAVLGEVPSKISEFDRRLHSSSVEYRKLRSEVELLKRHYSVEKTTTTEEMTTTQSPFEKLLNEKSFFKDLFFSRED